MSQRTARIDELLRQEIGQALERDLADPAIGFATVTDVETSPDLRHARVWVSVIGSEAEREAALAALRRALPYVRHELGGKLRLRRIPEFHVRLDDSMERGTRVLHILQQLEEGRSSLDVEVPAQGETLPRPAPRLPREGDAEEPPAEQAPNAPTQDADPTGHEPRRPRTGEPRARHARSPRGGTASHRTPGGAGGTRERRTRRSS